MGEDSAASASAGQDRTASGRRPQGIERDPVCTEAWLSLAGYASRVRIVRDGLEEAAEVAGGGGMDPDLAGVPGELGWTGEAGMVTGVFGWELRSGEKGGEEIGVTKVGKGTKRMLVADGNGIPLALLVARANQAEVKLAEATLDRVRVPRHRGRPRRRPERLVADKGYDSDRFRGWLRRKGVIPCIPPRENRRGRRKRWEEEYRERWRVERTFAWVGNFRRLVVRYERMASMYEAFCVIACILICLRELLK